MKAKRILLGLLIAGLVVIGLSGVVWAFTDIVSTFPTDSASGEVTVNITVDAWAGIYFSDNSISLPTLGPDMITINDDGTVSISPLTQQTTSKLVAATNYQGNWCVKAQLDSTLPSGLYGELQIATDATTYVALSSASATILETKSRRGIIYENSVKFRYVPESPISDSDYAKLDLTNNYSVKVKFTVTTP